MIHNISTGEESSVSPVRGFIGLSTLRRKAVLVYSDREFLSQLRVIPSMNFSCNGTISRWTFVALSRVGNCNKYPRFQLWRLTGPGTYERVYDSSTGSSGFMTADGSTLTIAEYVPPAPVQFGAGDVLGVYQPGNSTTTRLSVIHANVPSGFGNVNFVGGAADMEVFDTTASGESNDFPLVAVNTGKYHPCHIQLHVQISYMHVSNTIILLFPWGSNNRLGNRLFNAILRLCFLTPQHIPSIIWSSRFPPVCAGFS